MISSSKHLHFEASSMFPYLNYYEDSEKRKIYIFNFHLEFRERCQKKKNLESKPSISTSRQATSQSHKPHDLSLLLLLSPMLSSISPLLLLLFHSFPSSQCLSARGTRNKILTNCDFLPEKEEEEEKKTIHI